MAIVITPLDNQLGSGNGITSDSVAVANGDYLLVAGGGGKASAASDPLTSMSIDGNALSLLVESVPTATFNSLDWFHCSWWGLKITSSISAAVIGACAGGTDNAQLYLSIMKATGVDGVTPIGDTDSMSDRTGTGVPRSLTFTTTAGDVALANIVWDSSFSNTATPDGSQTETYNAGGSEAGLAAAYRAASGGSTALSWTNSIDFTFRMCGLVLNQAAGGGGGVLLKSPMVWRQPVVAQ